MKGIFRDTLAELFDRKGLDDLARSQVPANGRNVMSPEHAPPDHTVSHEQVHTVGLVTYLPLVEPEPSPVRDGSSPITAEGANILHIRFTPAFHPPAPSPRQPRRPTHSSTTISPVHITPYNHNTPADTP